VGGGPPPRPRPDPPRRPGTGSRRTRLTRPAPMPTGARRTAVPTPGSTGSDEGNTARCSAAAATRSAATASTASGSPSSCVIARRRSFLIPISPQPGSDHADGPGSG
jgi:hypothetical protein